MDALLFDAAARSQLKTSILNIGVEPGYRFELGTRDELHERVGIGVKAAKTKILQFIHNLNK
jgi:transketolase